MTAQVSEPLQFRDMSLSMCSTPLDVFLSSTPRNTHFQEVSTACWRRYVGRWEIRSDRLYLVGLSAVAEDGNPVGLEDLFPGFPDGVFAHWFTGEVRCPIGRQVKYVHMGFSSQFERDLFLGFKAGVLISERVVQNGKAPPGAPKYYGPRAWLARTVTPKKERYEE